MKKVAVLTFHRANNYGASLQAHALPYVINKLGAKAELLDYRPAGMEKLYHSKVPSYKGLKRFLALLHHRYLRDRATYRAFDSFRRHTMRISGQIYGSPSELKAADSLYDLFIVGSDQVWNPDITILSGKKADFSYFLDFVKDGCKKKSYAASLGVSELSEDDCRVYRDNLSSFSEISVREHKAAELLEHLLKRSVNIACDPVLLLSADEWMKFERPYPLPAQDYVLAYSVGGKKELMTYARQVAKEKQCAVYAIQPPIVGTVCSDSGQMLTGVGPAEFVWLIRHAKAVVTTSFHGSAFSLLYQKELHIVQKQEPSKRSRNSRFDSLFKYFGIDEKQISAMPNLADPTIRVCTTEKNCAAIEQNRLASTEKLRSLIS